MYYVSTVCTLNGVYQLGIFVLLLHVSNEASQPGAFSGKDVHFSATTEETVCSQNLFGVRCPPDHVIFIDSAKYTRRKGPCVGQTQVKGACECNVTKDLGKICSGRDYCSIMVLKTNFKNCLCSKDYNQNLHVNKTCIPVARGGFCEVGQSERLDMDLNEGHISSLTTNKTGYGNLSCPWVIPAGEWQQVEISVADFSTDASQTYFQIKTSDGQKLDHRPSAGSGTMMKFVAKVNGPNVKIGIITDNTGSPNGNFLIRYKVYGCRTPAALAAGTAKIVTKNRTFLMMDCGTGGLVNMTCNVTRWVPPGLCVGSFTGSASTGANWGAIVGGVLAALVLVVCIVVFVGKYRQNKDDFDDDSEGKDEKAKQPLKEPPSISKPMLIKEHEEPPPKDWNWRDPDRVKPEITKRRETAPAEMLNYAVPHKPLKSNVPDIIEEVEENEQDAVKINKKKPLPPPKPRGKCQIKT